MKSAWKILKFKISFKPLRGSRRLWKSSRFGTESKHLWGDIFPAHLIQPWGMVSNKPNIEVHIIVCCFTWAACHPGGHCWNYYPGVLSFKSSHCNPFENWAPVKTIKWDPLLWVIKVSGSSYFLYIKWHKSHNLYHYYIPWPVMYRKSSFFNSSSPNAAYMLQWIRSALVHIMVCCLFRTKPLSKPMLVYFQLDTYKQTPANF